MRYLPLTPREREEMRDFLGIKDVRELFTCIENQCYFPLTGVPAALDELQLIEKFEEYAKKNRGEGYLNYLGGGAYHHFIPEVVNYLSNRGEFVTPYTPYQPEVSQGSLQAMFEYQTMMTMLTAMDVANSSLYDGATAAAEAVLLSWRRSGKSKVLLSAALHPEYGETIKTYLQNLNVELQTVDFQKQTGKIDFSDLRAKIDDRTGAVVFQSPNFFGVVEDAGEISSLLRPRQVHAVQIIAEALSLGFLKPPGENGIDIVAGEAQSFGLPLGFGGPYLGFMAVRDEFLRQMPGRLVGQTKDIEGRRGYVLTLSTREQHIKREKATSNICTNQAWCALRAAIYLATMGQSGIAHLARINHLNTAYFVSKTSKLKNIRIRYQRDFYNEVVIDILKGDSDGFLNYMREKKILAGIPLKWFYKEQSPSVLMNFTEMHRKQDIDHLIQVLGEWQ